MWFRRKVMQGQKIGRTLGFPTLNFRVGGFGQHFKPGVYACKLKLKNQLYKGALYYGPKLEQSGKVLEIFVIDHSASLYGQHISFQVGKKIRGPIKFNSLESLRKQIEQDVSHIV